jgi:NAD(P)-dependent dehydrogenase (short-subunit alcohol dehydrogenase family)
MKLQGKVAIVTGASRGIGRQIVNELAELGADLALVSRKQDVLDVVAREVSETYGVKTFPIACHCGKPEQISSAVEKIAGHFGRIDILINNAATNPHFGLAIDGSPEMFAKILETNVVGYFAMIKACVPHMDKVGGGSVVNLSSMAGISPTPFIGLYSVSKFGVIGLTKMLARELGAKKIRVNSVAPGLIKTDFAQALWSNPAILEKATGDNPIPRIGDPSEPARITAWLATPAASFVTGAIYTCDGGATI